MTQSIKQLKKERKIDFKGERRCIHKKTFYGMVDGRCVKCGGYITSIGWGKGVKSKMSGGLLPSRPKWWKELKANEKVERTREVLKQVQRGIYNLESKIDELARHSHEPNGEAIIKKPLQRLGYGEVEQSAKMPERNPDEVYF